MFKPVIIKGMLWNGEFFLGRFPTELSFVKRGNHRVVALPALILDNDFVHKEVDAEETKNLLRKYGARNGKTTTNPPAGTTAIICNNTSNGIEPTFLLEYDRKMICNEWPEGLSADNIKELFEYHKKKDFEYWDGEYKNKRYYKTRRTYSNHADNSDLVFSLLIIGNGYTYIRRFLQ